MMLKGDRARISVHNLSKEFDLQDQGLAGRTLVRMLTGRGPSATSRKAVALDNISLDISEGERVGIIGRNGAGKTTLLSIIAGVSAATSGSIAVSGNVHAMLTIGAVLREEMSGRENIRLDRAVHGLSVGEIDARIDEIAAFSELGEFLDRPVRSYSSGMKARLAFSMGAFVSPDILIVDETLSVGDAFFAAKALARMRAIAQEGRIVIIVSHGLAGIVEMCTRCIWLDAGRIVMDGDPVRVTTAYERAVSQADESDLALKFGADDIESEGLEPQSLESVRLEQGGQPLLSRARAFVPVSVFVSGPGGKGGDVVADVELAIRRVDGRTITRQRLSDAGGRLTLSRPFCVRMTLDPMILGADLYRFELSLTRGESVLARKNRIVEVLDEEGQFGGRPLLYQAPDIAARPTREGL